MPLWNLDPDDVKQAIADGLRKDVDQLETEWDRMVADGVDFAETELSRILRDKGFTTTQIASWDDGLRYSKMLSTFFSYVLGAGLAEYQDRDYNKLDCRKSIEDMAAFSISGSLVKPGAEGFGPATGGRIHVHHDVPQHDAVFHLNIDNQTRWPQQRTLWRGREVP